MIKKIIKKDKPVTKTETKTPTPAIPDNDKSFNLPPNSFGKDKTKIIKVSNKTLPAGLYKTTTSDIEKIISTIPINSFVNTITLTHKLMTLIDPKTYSFKKNGDGNYHFNSSSKEKASKDPVYDFALHQLWSFVNSQKKATNPIIKKTDRGLVQRIA